jgi:hypothetical protein
MGKGQLKPNAPHIPQADAGVLVDFSKKGAFVFSAPETYEPSIDDIATLQEEVLEAYKAGRWKSDWAVVVRVVNAKTATILISKSSQSKLEIAINGSFQGAQFSLGDLNLGLTLNHQSGDVLNIVGARNVTPLFQLVRIKRRRWPLSGAKVGMATIAGGRLSPMADVTPERAKSEKNVAESLYLDLVTEADLQSPNGRGEKSGLGTS